jgi:hypothetical protein
VKRLVAGSCEATVSSLTTTVASQRLSPHNDCRCRGTSCLLLCPVARARPRLHPASAPSGGGDWLYARAPHTKFNYSVEPQEQHCFPAASGRLIRHIAVCLALCLGAFVRENSVRTASVPLLVWAMSAQRIANPPHCIAHKGRKPPSSGPESGGWKNET